MDNLLSWVNQILHAMKSVATLLLIFFCLADGAAQSRTLQEKLGYPRGTKLLIIHADDLGVAHAENAASIYALENGSVNSASIMVPCAWFPEIADYARKHPAADLGLHLTLTSEWKFLKWGPVAPAAKVPGLVNAKGFMYESADSVHSLATTAEVETELRAQIDRALQFGIDVTHLDSHMGTLFGKPELLQLLIRLGREYKIPTMLSKQMNPGQLVNEKDIVLDMIYTATPPDYKGGMENYYTRVFQSLPHGVSTVLIHTAYGDREMQAVTIDHPDWGAAWRQADMDFFTSDTCKNLLREHNIRLVTWREIRDKVLRAGN
jgi:chitin disaccharide deacetylase